MVLLSHVSDQKSQIPRVPELGGWLCADRVQISRDFFFMALADAECLDLLRRNGKFSVHVAEPWKGLSRADIIYQSGSWGC